MVMQKFKFISCIQISCYEIVEIKVVLRLHCLIIFACLPALDDAYGNTNINLNK